MLVRFIEQLSSELGFTDPLAPNEDGSYSIEFDPKIHVSLKENSEQMIKLNTVLTPLPKEQKEDYLLHAMSGNLFGEQTAANVVGLDEGGKNVTLSRFVFPEATYSQFRDSLEEFLNYAEVWRLETKAFA